MSVPPPYQPQPRHIEPHPQMWQQPGPGYIVPPGHSYPAYGPPAQRQPSGGRIAMFVIAAALSAIVWLFGVLLLASTFLNHDGEVTQVLLLIHAIIITLISAFCIWRAVRTKFRYLWSILLLLTNTVLPGILVVSILIIMLVFFGGLAALAP